MKNSNNNSQIVIKLFRNPDKHFYEFIKEYGIIIDQKYLG